MHVLRTQFLNMISFQLTLTPRCLCDSYSNESALLCSPYLPPPATSQDHFLFRAQVDPSVGHKGVMLKTQYSFKLDIAHGGSFACGVAAHLSADSERTARRPKVLVLCIVR